MTSARDEWIRSRQRRRQAISWSAALGTYLLVMLVMMLFSALSIKELSDYSGPVIVRLGSPTGAEIAKPVAEPKPAAAAAQLPQPAAATPNAAAPVPVPKPAQKPTVPSAPTTPAAAQQPATPTATPSATPTTPQPAQPVVVLRGSESGNSYDMTVNGGGGTVGRSLYVPIWLYLPVPYELSASFHDSIPDMQGLPGTAARRRAVFETHYEKKPDGSWQLKRLRQPDYDARPELWTMLEDAGYNVKSADYKEGKHLRAIGILFKVSASGPGGKAPTLEDVHLEESSGYGDIDQAVLYGFRKAEFSNSGTSSIGGRFTYRF